MCAIFGANFDISYNNELVHRRKDDYGEYKDKFVSLFRLSILDISTNAKQPFTYKDYVLVYNGEIYNYLELKKELKEYNFKTSSDTEVLLYAYDKWKEEFLHKLNGDFAFCIYNKKTKKLFYARDRVGNKPFYYYYKNKQFTFSSEIRGLKRYIKEFHIQKLGDAILFSINDNDEFTIYKDIYNLKPSHYLVYDLKNNKLSIKQWYKLPKKEINDFNFALEEFEELFDNAIKIRLRSDVSIGSMISGGIDSSIVAYFISKYKSIDFYSIIHHNYPSINEEYFIDLIKHKLNLKIKKLTPSFEDLHKDLNDLIFTQSDIFRSLSIYIQYFLFKFAKVKVMLSGQGADELFGGYYHHIARFLINKKNLIDRINLYKSKAIEEASLAIKFSLPKNEKLLLLKEENKQNEKFLKELFNNYTPNYDLLIEKFNKNIAISLKNDTFKTNLPQLLRYEDRNSMNFSIENRTPFTDYRIIEFALNLPKEFKFKNGYSKYFLRKFSEKFLPKEVVYRLDKKGFEAPELDWLKKMGINYLFEWRKFLFLKLQNIYVGE